MLVAAVNLAKVFLKVIGVLIKKREQAPVILITQAKIMKLQAYLYKFISSVDEHSE